MVDSIISKIGCKFDEKNSFYFVVALWNIVVFTNVVTNEFFVIGREFVVIVDAVVK